MAIYVFWLLYISFDGYILLWRYKLLLALPDCDFVRIQHFPTISCICGLKARIEFNINLLALIYFCFFCGSMKFSVVQCSLMYFTVVKCSWMVSSINFNSTFSKCWKCESFFNLRCKPNRHNTSNRRRFDGDLFRYVFSIQISTSFRRAFPMKFRSNFDGQKVWWKTDANWVDDLNLLLKDKKSLSFWNLILKSFWYFKN